MRFRSVIALQSIPIVLVLWLIQMSPAGAQDLCLDYPEVVDHLMKTEHQSRLSVALDAAGAAVEVFANLETGTWSIVLTQPGDLSCIIGSGTHFETFEPTPPGTLG